MRFVSCAPPAAAASSARPAVFAAEDDLRAARRGSAEAAQRGGALRGRGGARRSRAARPPPAAAAPPLAAARRRAHGGARVLRRLLPPILHVARGVRGRRAASAREGGARRPRVRFVFLQAPRRKISCYDGNPSERAWHDYLTDHGGDEGRPELEEEINGAHLATCRAQIHRAVDAEAAALAAAGGLRRVALMGESQGACVAADAAVTHRGPGAPAGVFCSYGQLYKPTPIATPSKKQAQLRRLRLPRRRRPLHRRLARDAIVRAAHRRRVPPGHRFTSSRSSRTRSDSAAEDALLATALETGAPSTAAAAAAGERRRRRRRRRGRRRRSPPPPPSSPSRARTSSSTGSRGSNIERQASPES